MPWFYLTTPSKNRQSTFCAYLLIRIANKSTARQALPSWTFLFWVGFSKSRAVPFWILKVLAPWFKLLERCLVIEFIRYILQKTLFKIACLQYDQYYPLFGQNPVLDISLCHFIMSLSLCHWELVLRSRTFFQLPWKWSELALSCHGAEPSNQLVSHPSHHL